VGAGFSRPFTIVTLSSSEEVGVSLV
jgi:hypothetical protein